MDYIIMQGEKMVSRAHTQDEGIAKLDKLYQDWKLNAPRNPHLRLYYNGFKAVLIKEYPPA